MTPFYLITLYLTCVCFIKVLGKLLESLEHLMFKRVSIIVPKNFFSSNETESSVSKFIFLDYSSKPITPD